MIVISDNLKLSPIYFRSVSDSECYEMSGIGIDNTLDIDAFNSNITCIPVYVGSYLFESLLYGVYVVLFAFCVHLLLGNRKPSKWFYLAVVGTLFAITTADTGMTIHHAFVYVLPGKRVPAHRHHWHPKFIFFITSHLIAVSILIHRCYVVWHYKKVVIIFPCVLLLFITTCGYTLVISHFRRRQLGALLLVYLWMIFALNLCITALTVGKILWNARRVRSILGSGMAGRCYSLSTIILDSGVIYSVYILLDLVVPLIMFDAGLIQVVGIISTSIIIRLALESRDDETTSIRRSPEVMQSNTPVLDSIFSTVGTTPAIELPGNFDDNGPNVLLSRK